MSEREAETSEAEQHHCPRCGLGYSSGQDRDILDCIKIKTGRAATTAPRWDAIYDRTGNAGHIVAGRQIGESDIPARSRWSKTKKRNNHLLLPVAGKENAPLFEALTTLPLSSNIIGGGASKITTLNVIDWPASIVVASDTSCVVMARAGDATQSNAAQISMGILIMRNTRWSWPGTL